MIYKLLEIIYFELFGFSKKFLLTIFIIILVYSIKCWDCRSDADPKCSDPFDNTTFAITDCKQSPELDYIPHVRATMCRKIRQKGKSQLIRSYK